MGSVCSNQNEEGNSHIRLQYGHPNRTVTHDNEHTHDERDVRSTPGEKKMDQTKADYLLAHQLGASNRQAQHEESRQGRVVMSATRESQCASPTAEEDDEILRLSNLLIMASASLSALEEARRERQEATQASTIPRRQD